MDEFPTVLKARRFIKDVGSTTVPASLEAYVEHVGAVIRRERDLEPDEPGFSFLGRGRHHICVNAKDSPERQRFSICHELAHIVLQLPSDHKAAMPWWSYAGKPPNEILCDVFAAEVLLPYNLFRPLVAKSDFSLAAVDELAQHFAASNMATGSRFATFCPTPCAFVLSEEGKVRYTSRSMALRDVGAWIPTYLPLPEGSVAERIRREGVCDGPEEVPAEIWFSHWDRGGVLLEDARHLTQWDQTVALLWFEDEEVPPLEKDHRRREEAEFGLAELDGILPWPDKRRRR